MSNLLTNEGLIDGLYNGVPFEDSKSTLVTVQIEDIPFTKEADQDIWFSGDLMYTLKLDNSGGAGPITQLVMKDHLDKTKFTYTAGSLIVVLNHEGTDTTLTAGTDYTVTVVTDPEDATKDLMTITFLAGGQAAEIAVGDILTATFRGTKTP